MIRIKQDETFEKSGKTYILKSVDRPLGFKLIYPWLGTEEQLAHNVLTYNFCPFYYHPRLNTVFFAQQKLSRFSLLSKTANPVFDALLCNVDGAWLCLLCYTKCSHHTLDCT